MMLVEPSAAAGTEQSLHFLEDHSPATVSLIVGPEGGWSQEERQQAEAEGCIAVTLGGLTLRADAVAVTAVAIVRFALKDL
jgi:16S rRNA (uracil1498-N3)-methyltransferase